MGVLRLISYGNRLVRAFEFKEVKTRSDEPEVALLSIRIQTSSLGDILFA
jgi:hypothetical protein